MKYSILIPAYKSRFFKECLDSIFCLDYDDFEVIILNDSSPEPIKDIAGQYHDHRLRYYENKKNVGAENLVDNWNKLLSLAKGEFVICMGDDDKLDKNCLSEYDKLMSSYPNLDIYHARTLMIDENSEPCDIQEERPEWESMYSMIWNQMFKGRTQFIGDYLFHREALIARGGFYKLPYAMASDWLIGYIMAKDKGVANLKEPVFFYRTSRYTITGNVPGEALLSATLQHKKELKKLLSDEPSDKIDKLYRKDVLNDLDYHFSKDITNNMATDLARTSFRSLLFWFRKRRKANISLVGLLYSIMLGLYRKIRS